MEIFNSEKGDKCCLVLDKNEASLLHNSLELAAETWKRKRKYKNLLNKFDNELCCY